MEQRLLAHRELRDIAVDTRGGCKDDSHPGCRTGIEEGAAGVYVGVHVVAEVPPGVAHSGASRQVKNNIHVLKQLMQISPRQIGLN